MYKHLIDENQGAIAFNLENADRGDVERSYYTAGMAKAYTDVLRGLGHEVEIGTWNDNGCDRIGFVKIDGVGAAEKVKPKRPTGRPPGLTSRR